MLIPTLSLLASMGPRVDEPRELLNALSMPEVASDDRWAEWHILTDRRDPRTVRATIGAWAKRRDGWTVQNGGWRYQARSTDVGRFLAIDVRIFKGRAMPLASAAPLREVWTTVLVSVHRSMVTSGPVPHEDWVLATRPQDDAALNETRGEERNLARFTGLRLVAHRTVFGRPWWLLTGPGRREEIEARIEGALRGRPGWSPLPWSGSMGGVSTQGVNWSYGAPGHRPLTLLVSDGKALPEPPKAPVEGSWTTVTAIAEEPTLTQPPVGVWGIYR